MHKMAVPSPAMQDMAVGISFALIIQLIRMEQVSKLCYSATPMSHTHKYARTHAHTHARTHTQSLSYCALAWLQLTPTPVPDEPTPGHLCSATVSQHTPRAMLASPVNTRYLTLMLWLVGCFPR